MRCQQLSWKLHPKYWDAASKITDMSNDMDVERKYYLTLRWAWGRKRPQSIFASGESRPRKDTVDLIFCENYTIWVYLIFQ